MLDSSLSPNSLPGHVFRHFKGNYYYVESIAYHSETDEPLVIYRPLYADAIHPLFARPLSMFLESIPEDREGNITHQSTRFTLAESLSKDYLL